MKRAPSLADSPRLRIGVAAALGVLHAASFVPPLGQWWLQIFALAGLFALAAPAPGIAPRRQAPMVAVFGFAWFVTGLAWLHTSMHVYGGMPWLIAALAVALFALYLCAFPVAAVALATRWGASESASGGSPGTGSAWLGHSLALGGFWGASEMARGYLLTGFPWLGSGYAHVDGPLAGFAPWVGVYGIGALAAVVASLLASAALPGAGGRRRAEVIGAAAAILLCGALLARIPPTEPSGPPVAVRLAQGNVPQQLKFDRERSLSAMHDYTAFVETSGAALVVLPETAWTLPWHATPPDVAARILAATADGSKAVAIGMPLRQPAADAASARARYTNSVALIAASSGQAPDSASIAARYDKRHLVPFGEFVPPGFAWFVELMEIPLGEFARGARGQPAFEVGGQRFAFNICYEDLFGEELLESIRGPAGATVLVNVSNIAWFGDSQALAQHLAIARMRTLETGRPMLRSTNTGVTAAIDHRGRVIGRLANYTAGVLDVTVQGTAGLSAYVRHGNALPVALFLGLALLARARRRASRGS